MSALWDAFATACLTDRALFTQFRELADPAAVGDTQLSTLLHLVGEFYDTYGRGPMRDEMLARLERLPGSEAEKVDNYKARARRLYDEPARFGSEVLRTEVLEAVRRHKLAQVLVNGGRMVDMGRVDYDRIMDEVKGVLSLSADSDMGIEVGRDVAKVVEAVTVEEMYETIPTGLSGLDRIIGGWRAGQLACGMAASGVGKSTFLINHAVAAALSGRDVLILTVELEDTAVVERVIRRIAKVDRKNLQAKTDHVERWLGKFFALTRSRLVVKYARPGKFSVDDLVAYLDRAQSLMGFEPAAVFVDYLDEMRAGPDDRKKDTRHQHSGVTRDLIGMAKDRGIVVCTMTQTKREAIGKKRVTMKDVGEDYGKIKQGDVTFAICQTDDEYRQGRARVRILKNRDGPGVGREVPVLVDYKTMFVKSLDVSKGAADA